MLKIETINLVCTPPPHPFLLWREGGEPPTEFTKSGVLHRISIFRGGLLGKKGVTFFRGGVWGYSFYIKNKLKSEIFNDKKSLYTKMFFSIITKNFNWEILTNNLLTFKRWDGVEDEKI